MWICTILRHGWFVIISCLMKLNQEWLNQIQCPNIETIDSFSAQSPFIQTDDIVGNM